MPEMIDKAEALKHTDFDYDERFRIVHEWLLTAPTIEAEPVRRGRWLEDHKQLGSLHYCSVCRTSIYVGIGISFDVTSFLFCPFCGADMREEGADNG